MYEYKPGKAYANILKRCESQGGQVFIVLDPPKQTPEVAGKMARAAEESGLDAIAVGGSVGAQGPLLEDTITHIKDNCSLDVILFPGNIATLSAKADALYYMSMLNSNDPYYISGAQTVAAYPMKQAGIEPIPTSYIIVSPGRAAGWVGRAQPIPRDMPYLGAVTALGGQYMGSMLTILESGGGAPTHAPLDMVTMTRQMTDIPLLVAGGVKTPEDTYKVIKAGADIVHVGTALEHTSDSVKKSAERMKALTDAARKAGKEKR